MAEIMKPFSPPPTLNLKFISESAGRSLQPFFFAVDIGYFKVSNITRKFHKNFKRPWLSG